MKNTTHIKNDAKNESLPTLASTSGSWTNISDSVYGNKYAEVINEMSNNIEADWSYAKLTFYILHQGEYDQTKL